MSTTAQEVLEAAENLGDALAADQDDRDSEAFDDLVTRCNQTIEQEIGIDYGELCSDDGCC